MVCSGTSIQVLRVATAGSLLSVLLFFIFIIALLVGSTSALPEATEQMVDRWEKRIVQLLPNLPEITSNDQRLVIHEAAVALVEWFPYNWAPSDFSIGCWLLTKEQLILRQLDELERFPALESKFDDGFAFVYNLDMAQISPLVAHKLANRSIKAIPKHRHFKFARPFIKKPEHDESFSAMSSLFYSSNYDHSFALSELMPTLDDELDPYNFSLEIQQADATSKSFDSSTLTKSSIEDILYFSKYAKFAYILSSDSDQHSRIVHQSHLNDIFELPFFICLDHEWKSIVIGMRGTRTTDDILVDIKISGELLDKSLGEEYRVRSGFLKTALNVFDMIQSSKVLEKLVCDEELKDYRLVLTGHSLGASVASILTYFIRTRMNDREIYRNAICYGYCVPAFASDQTAELFEDFTVSVVCGHDIVSRLSYLSFNYFIDDVERMLKNCNLPKHNVVRTILIGLFSKTNGQTLERPANLQRASSQLDLGNDTLADLLNGERKVPDYLLHETCSVPGKILYLEKLRDFQGRFGKPAAEIPPRPNKLSIISTIRDRKLKKIFKDIVSGKWSRQFVKSYYVPRWASRREFKELTFSRSTIPDHSNIFDLLHVYDGQKPDHSLRASLYI